MSPLPLHSDLFAEASSPEGNLNHPEVEVSSLLSRARLIQDLPASVSHALSYTNGSLYDLMSTQVQLIQKRSGEWNDHQVTVYDKVLLTLTSNGDDLSNRAAIVFFCNQYLGNDIRPDRELPAAIASRLQAQRILNEHHSKTQSDSVDLSTMQETASLPFQELASSSPGTNDLKKTIGFREQQKRRAIDTDCDTTVCTRLGTVTAFTKPSVARLWKVLERAEHDFSSVKYRTVDEATQAARYLRDTAENAILCLQDRSLDEHLIGEAERLYARAEKRVLELNGGKKRKFDSSELDRARRCPRVDSSSSSPCQNRDAQPHDRFEDSRNGEKCRSIGRLRDSDHRRNDASRARRVKRQGRGPSGIPYGYSRPVDQYTPVYHRQQVLQTAG